MRKTREKRSTFSLSGWLFADLLLGLTMVFFLANSRGTPAQPTATRTPTAITTIAPTPTDTATPPLPPSNTATATTPVLPPPSTHTATATVSATRTAAPTPTRTAAPTPTRTPLPIGMSQNPICYNITVDGEHLLRDYSDEQEQQLESIRDDLRDMLPNESTVRVGMVLVWARGDTLGEGVQMAKKVRDVIKREFPDSFLRAASKGLYSDSIGKLGAVQIEIYFFSDGEWHTGSEVKCNMVTG